MFGLSAAKVILIVAVVVLVWYVVRWVNRYGALRQVSPWMKSDRNAPEPTPAVELERNPVTGTYEPKRDDRRP
jgi:hypothetical protein